MKTNHHRREFIKTAKLAGIGLGLTRSVFPVEKSPEIVNGGKIGLIGLDTSHVTAFTRTINDSPAGSEFDGFRVTAAYPTKGSPDMPESINRIDGFTKSIREMGVEIVGSIDELLEKVDFVLLESVDGRRHLAEALPVLKAGKRMYIDKPLSNSLVGAIAILEASKKYNAPIFSSSSTRFSPVSREIVQGREGIGKVLGVDAYGSGYKVIDHIDMAYYGIHAIECLFTLMGTGCKSVIRVHNPKTDIIVGTWEDDRVGVYRTSPRGSGAKVYGEDGIEDIRTGAGYTPLLVEVMEYFRTGIVPVTPEETIELFAFMKAADESRLYGGTSINIEALIQKATRQARTLI